jgi:hypothetical protein
MKKLILSLATATLTAACAIHTTVGPKPDYKPAMASNKATQKSIAEVRTEIKGSQVNLKAGATALEVVDQYLKLLVGLPPKQQNYVVAAQSSLHQGMSEYAAAADKIANADKRASDAEQHAADTAKKLETLGVEIEKAHDREKALAKDNARMKPVYEECTAWWDLGSGWYFVRHLVKHLLILAGVAIALLAVLSIASSLGVPGLGFALSFAKRLLGGASSISSRAVAAARSRATSRFTK